MILNIPPHSKESEKALIGSMIIDNDIINLVSLEQSDFYIETLGKIYNLCKQIRGIGKSVDLVILKEYLDSKGILEEVGGIVFLMELTEASVLSSNWKEYEDIIKDKSIRRQIIKKSYEMKALAEDESTEANESLKAISGIDKILFSKNEGHTIIDLVEDFDKARELYHENGGMLGLPTPYPQLDEYTKGLKRKKVFTVAAFSNSGKTTITYTYVKKLLKEGQKVVWFTLDGDKQTVICDMIQCMYNKTQEEIMDEKFYFDMGDFENLTVYEGSKTLEEIESIGHVIEPYAIVVDYVQKLHIKGYNNRTQELDEIAHRMQDIAVNTNSAVITLSQVPNESRGSKGDVNLKGSGELYSAADDIILLYRDGKETKVKVIKTKKGITGVEFLLCGDFNTYSFNLVKELDDKEFSF